MDLGQEPKPLKQNWRGSSEPVTALGTLAVVFAVLPISAWGYAAVSLVYAAYAWDRVIQKVNRADFHYDGFKTTEWRGLVLADILVLLILLCWEQSRVWAAASLCVNAANYLLGRGVMRYFTKLPPHKWF